MSSIFKKEDYWAIWIGFTLLLGGIILFFVHVPTDMDKHQQLEAIMQQESEKAPFKTLAWYQAFHEQQKIKGTNTNIGKRVKSFTSSKPSTWKDNPLDAFIQSKANADAKNEAGRAKYEAAQQEVEKLAEVSAELQNRAAKANYQDKSLNKTASDAIEAWQNATIIAAKAKKKINNKPFNKLWYLLGLMLFLGAFFTLGATVMGEKALSFFKGFVIIFLIGVLAYWLAGQANMKAIGFGYAAWAIVIGLLISNTIGTPKFLAPALKTEFYIKTGLVLLGAEILFGKILAIGLPGIFVAWVVTPIVLVSTYWFGQRILKIPSKTLNITISADMSVCGVSAAVATAAAAKASKEELTLAVGLSMIFTSIMMIVLPAIINAVGMSEVLGGAWIGGTIDATGAVVAAGAFLGDTALNVAATIKMIQNVLIGLIAFGVAVYFASNVENDGQSKVGLSEIWKRFPRFILGFIGASVLFSIIYEMLGNGEAYTLIDQGVIAGFSKNLRGWLFCLAFVSIGLSTNFKTLNSHFKGGKPLILYVCGQLFNLLLTLLMAYLMFYKVFPHITDNI
jgi:uncharacterized integral membrane protein (TIGR00698 family)